MAIRLSDYNRIMQMTGRKTLQLQGDETALFSEYARNMDDARNLLTSYLESNKSISIGGKSYTMNPRLIPDSIVTSSGGYLFGLIVPDDAVTGFEPNNNSLIFNCKGDSSAMQDKFVDDMTAFYKGQAKTLHMYVATRNLLKASYAGSKAVISFVGIYLGLIFLITSAAILALQQLSEVSDNRRRYAILQKIGADEKLINRSIFKQTAIYFVLPLLLACVHSVVGIAVANDAISSLAGVDAVSNILITALVILAVYGTYFIATYLGSKSIILKNDIRTE
jgi:putative ABC transport system permease protein